MDQCKLKGVLAIAFAVHLSNHLPSRKVCAAFYPVEKFNEGKFKLWSAWGLSEKCCCRPNLLLISRCQKSLKSDESTFRTSFSLMSVLVTTLFSTGRLWYHRSLFWPATGPRKESLPGAVFPPGTMENSSLAEKVSLGGRTGAELTSKLSHRSQWEQWPQAQRFEMGGAFSGDHVNMGYHKTWCFSWLLWCLPPKILHGLAVHSSFGDAETHVVAVRVSRTATQKEQCASWCLKQISSEKQNILSDGSLSWWSCREL